MYLLMKFNVGILYCLVVVHKGHPQSGGGEERSRKNGQGKRLAQHGHPHLVFMYINIELQSVP
jgi:hypothetical protein